MCCATHVQPKIGTDKIIQCFTHSTWFFTLSENDFRGLHLDNLKSLLRWYTTLAQHDFYCISEIWFRDSAPAQPEIFVDDMVVHYIHTALLSRHLYNLVSGFCVWAAWNLYLYGKVAYFALRSHVLIFITFAKHGFRGFFILIACIFSCICIFRTYICVWAKSWPAFGLGGGWVLGYNSMKFWDFPGLSYFPDILNLKLFDNSYILCLLLIITLRFTCGENKVW